MGVGVLVRVMEGVGVLDCVNDGEIEGVGVLDGVLDGVRVGVGV